ncbi:hypothetical protein GCM10009733_044190 [Nonomuraea maheshkhaliensis]|uniref:Uncharacterized protein n=1 Tax=Nonomuraea maheshkhaliensis TaxID=419590 RepID=A0ABP4R9D1_9ACTN
MLAALGFGSICLFTVLVMTKRISAVAGLVLIPTVFGLPALAVIAFSLAVTINWPSLRVQNEKLKPHAGTVVMVISLILAAGAFSGVLNESGMVKAMSDALVAHLPR